jgi:hypothetical protein
MRKNNQKAIPSMAPKKSLKAPNSKLNDSLDDSFD